MMGGLVHPYWCYWEEEKWPAMVPRDLYAHLVQGLLQPLALVAEL